jgi:hypothetical protein
MKLNFCAVCGKPDDDGILEFHHFIPKSEGGSDDETNLLTLCYSCHGVIHGIFRKNIKDLTKKGLKKAKESGKRLGNPNPRKGSEAGIQVIKQNATYFAEKIKPEIEQIIFIQKKLSLREIATELINRQVKTPRGGTKWSGSQVSNLLKMLKIDTYRIKQELKITLTKTI